MYLFLFRVWLISVSSYITMVCDDINWCRELGWCVQSVSWVILMWDCCMEFVFHGGADFWLRARRSSCSISTSYLEEINSLLDWIVTLLKVYLHEVGVAWSLLNVFGACLLLLRLLYITTIRYDFLRSIGSLFHPVM